MSLGLEWLDGGVVDAAVDVPLWLGTGQWYWSRDLATILIGRWFIDNFCLNSSHLAHNFGFPRSCDTRPKRPAMSTCLETTWASQKVDWMIQGLRELKAWKVTSNFFCGFGIFKNLGSIWSSGKASESWRMLWSVGVWRKDCLAWTAAIWGPSGSWAFGNTTHHN